MFETVKFNCPYCGTQYDKNFSVPSDEEVQKYVDGKYIPCMTSIYCDKCEIWFQRGIAVLTETYVR